ncbi:hypothetical protein AX17_003298 [Amanita inopinata Kibby_2008]|nr:hypothetical protein AX17_003298 [Amanita inopinata Kibby_2008]
MAAAASLPAYMLPGVPVHQPAHLEGDANLATEILPGPPSLLSAQQSAQKRDPRKPSTAYSYLPTSDPGSTYSGIMHGTLVGQELDGPRTKRSRLDKGTSSRAQRASARNQLLNTDSTAQSEVITTPTPPAAAELDTTVANVDVEFPLSRTTSLHNVSEGVLTSNMGGRSRRRDKGKARETDPPIVRVKEEPKVVSLHSPEPPMIMTSNNEDHCSSCRSQGILVYCDGCPRAFHLLCLDPPLEKVDDGDSRWYCPACIVRKQPPRKPPPSLLSPLIYQVETSIPTEYQLPDDIRNFYKDVATGPRGTYIDASELRPPRLNRHGQLEDREAYRLRDRNGASILCFRCGTSALPDGLAATGPAMKRAHRFSPKSSGSDARKSIISCDYCSLHWHLDCLDPPLPSLPPISRKWMCPNHTEHVLPSKRRIPRQNAAPIEITKLNEFNNGNVEIIYPETAANTQNTVRTPVDEVLINGRRYRVPEKIILLDFWGRLHQGDLQKDKDLDSELSSPLTSLTSLEDLEDRVSPDSSVRVLDQEDMKVAQILLGLNLSKKVAASPPSLMSTGMQNKKHMVDSGVQTIMEQANTSPSKAAKASKITLKRAPLQIPHNVNGITRVPTVASVDSSTAPSTLKRRRSTQVQSESSTRELRSRKIATAINDSSLTSISSKGSILEPPPGLAQTSLSFSKKTVHIKLEEPNLEHRLKNGFADVESNALSSTVKSMPKRNRVSRRSVQRDADEVRKEEKRGRKRKVREEETQEVRQGNLAMMTENNEKTERKKRGKDSEKMDKEKKRAIRTPTRPVPNANATLIASGQSIPAGPATPSLKIRLPRLNSLNSLHNLGSSGINSDAPARV